MPELVLTDSKTRQGINVTFEQDDEFHVEEVTNGVTILALSSRHRQNIFHVLDSMKQIQVSRSLALDMSSNRSVHTPLSPTVGASNALMAD